MKPIWTVIIFLLVVGIAIVSLAVPFVVHLRKKNQKDPPTTQTTTITTTEARVTSVSTKRSTTTTTSSSMRPRSTTERNIIVTVNGSIISSIYPITLDSYSQTLQQVYYPFALTYFEAVEIVVSVTGNYTIGSLGNIDTIGYLYENNINLDFMWLNLLQTDFWGMDIYSFLITSTLQASYKYVLLATTLEGPLTGSFQIQVSGPGTVNFTTVIVSNSSNLNLVESSYSSALTNQSLTFCRLTVPCESEVFYYYKLIELNITVDGTYSITSSSSLDTYGYLYQDAFNPANISQNLLLENDDGGGNRQFNLVYKLHATIKYFLVVTTYVDGATGEFSINTFGPGVINFIV